MSRATKICEHCGGRFERHPSFGRSQWENTKFCSMVCSGAAASLRNAEERPSLQGKFNSLFTRGEGCWEWQGTIDGYGYGVVDYAGSRYRAHVLALEFDGRTVPQGMVACHHCDNPRCVRPDHLYVGTQRQNVQDASRRGRLLKGDRHHQSKLTENQVREIRRLDLPYAEIARLYGVSRPTVTRAIKGKTWRHVK